MERLLARLERSFLGRLAIPNITTVIVGGMAFVFLLLYTKPELYPYLTLDPSLALHQPWRLVTFLFLPRSSGIIWVLFALYWTWLVGHSLEQEWGSFKLNVYYLLGALGTLGAGWITGMPQGNFWLNASLGLAFATLFPDYEIRLYLIVPIKAKWLGIAAALGVVWFLIEGDNGTRAAIGVAFTNYILFFGGHLLSLARGQQLQYKQATRRAAMRAPARRQDDDDDDARSGSGSGSGSGSAPDEKKCAICGVLQKDGADIRVCSCEKCGGPRQLCLEHARNH